MSSLINKWNDKTIWRDMSFKALTIMPNLLLQKTSPKSKSKENKEHLKRKMVLWQQGKIFELMYEGKSLQDRLPQSRKNTNNIPDTAKRFRNFIISGNINGALRLLENESSAGVLPINPETTKLLQEKHPEAEPKFDEMLLQGPQKLISPVIFYSITPDLIQKIAIRTKGAAGPSLLNADDWRRILGTKLYGTEGVDLCKAIANLAKRLCTEDIEDPETISALMACRLIPLDKSPGLRPISIGEVLRRIISKSVTFVLKPDMQMAAGGLQLCVGQEGGAEAAIHAMTEIFADNETHGIIQVDANNAFNTINRKVLLHNITIMCPELSIYVNNCYKQPARLFVTGGIEILSSEGTTQGDPVAMPIYAIGIIPLMTTIIALVNTSNEQVKHAAFADDLTGAGTINALKIWWESIIEVGPLLGYTANASKSWIIVKVEYLKFAQQIFQNSGIQITSEGRRNLGATIGSETFKDEYVNGRIDKWIQEVITSKIAMIEPHAVYAGFTHGLRHKYTYIMRTIPGISEHLKRLDAAITNHLVKALFHNHECNEIERELFSLPMKLGGLGIIIPSEMSDIQFRNSQSVTRSLVEHIVEQREQLQLNHDDIKQHKNTIKTNKTKHNKERQSKIKSSMSNEKLKLLEATTEASNWLSALSIKCQGFYLDKQSFLGCTIP